MPARDPTAGLPPRAASSFRADSLAPVRLAEVLATDAPEIAGLEPGTTAGVLFLVQETAEGPALLLTKRSPHVKQPGDLCCPGGRLHPALDGVLGWLLRCPCTPLTRSPGWRAGPGRGRSWRRQVGRHWACGLRECWEEIGLRPFGVTFLGALPPHRLALFRRTIVPLVARIEGTPRLRLNWEVERVVTVPFAALLEPGNYGVYRVDADWPPDSAREGPVDFPCFFHSGGRGRETLWGATYAVTVAFLARVFGFAPPPEAERPRVSGELSPTYTTGRPRD